MLNFDIKTFIISFVVILIVLFKARNINLHKNENNTHSFSTLKSYPESIVYNSTVEPTVESTLPPNFTSSINPENDVFLNDFLQNKFTKKLPYTISDELARSLNYTTEIMECATGNIDCTNFPIARSNLVNIPTEIYKKLTHNQTLHTDYTKTDVVTEIYDNTVKVVITPKDSYGNQKKYHGDKFIARLFYRGKNGTQNDYSHIIMINLEHKIDENGGVYYIGENRMSKIGVYEVQVYFLRSAEFQDTIRRVMNGFYTHNLQYSCGMMTPLLDNQKTNRSSWVKKHVMVWNPCGAGLNFIYANLGRDICAIDKTLGKEWFVLMGQRAVNKRIASASDSSIFRINSPDQEVPLCDDEFVNIFKSPATTHYNVIRRSDNNFIHENEGYEEKIYSRNVTCETENKTGMFNYVDDSNWVSKFPRKIKDPVKILTNKTLIMVGDSIFRCMRQYLYKFVLYDREVRCMLEENDWDFLGLDKNRKWCENRFGEGFGKIPSSKTSVDPTHQRFYCKSHNITLIWLHHGLPYSAGPDSCVKDFNHAEDVMDRMIDHNWLGKSYILFIDTGVHLSYHNPITLATRLLHIKKKADELKKMSNDTVIIYRTVTSNRGPMQRTSGLVSAFQQNRLNEVGVRIMQDSDSVVLMDSWPLIETQFDKMSFGNIHPPGDLLKAEISYFLDLYCVNSGEC